MATGGGINVGSAYLTILPSARGFSGKLASEMRGELREAGVDISTQMEQSVKQAEGGVKASFARWSGYATAAAGVMTGVLGASVIQTGLEYNAMSQSATAAFTAILGSAEAAASMMDDIKAFASTSPFPRQAFITAAQQMAAFGIETEKIIPLLGNVQDAVAAMGGGEQEIADLALIMAQIQSTGKITGEELLQFAERGVDALGMLADQAGISREAMRDLISSGGVDADTALSGIAAGIEERFAGAAEGVKNTWVGSVDRIKGAIRDMGSALVEPFVSVSGGGAAVEWANSIADGLRVVEAAVPGVVSLIKTGKFESEAWAKTSIGESSPFVKGLLIARDVVKSLVETVTGVVDTIRERFTSLQSTFGSGGGFAAFGENLAKLGAMLGDEIIPLISRLANILATSFTDIGSVLGVSTWSLFNTALSLTLDVVEVLLPVLEGLASILESQTWILDSLVGGYVAYKGAVQAISFTKLIASYLTMDNLRKLSITRIYGEIAAWVALRIEVVRSAAATAAGWAKTAAGAIAAGARSVATLIAMGARWVWSAAMATASAVKIAAAWVVSLGPIAWVIAAIAAVVAAIVALWVYWDDVSAWLAAAWEWIAALAVEVWGSIVEFFTGIWDSIVAAIIEKWTAVTEFLSTIWNAIWSVIQYFGLLFVTFLAGVWETIVAVATGIWNGFLAVLGAIWELIVSLVSGAVEGVKSALSWFGNLAGLAIEWFGAFLAGALDALGDLVSWVGTLPGKLLDALGDLGSLMLSAGKDILYGLLEGMKSVSGAVLDWIGGLLSSMGDAVLDFFGISSPAKFTIYAAEMIGLGFIKGFRDSERPVHAAAVQMAVAAAPPVETTFDPPPVYPGVGPSDVRDAADAARDVTFTSVVEVDSREIARATDKGARRNERRR